MPAIGDMKAADVCRPHIADLVRQLRHIPYQANRTLGVLSKLFNLAEAWGIRPDGSNPTRHVERYKERKRERYLTPDELTRLGQELARAETSDSEFERRCCRLPPPAVHRVSAARNPDAEMGSYTRRRPCFSVSRFKNGSQKGRCWTRRPGNFGGNTQVDGQPVCHRRQETKISSNRSRTPVAPKSGRARG